MLKYVSFQKKSDLTGLVDARCFVEWRSLSRSYVQGPGHEIFTGCCRPFTGGHGLSGLGNPELSVLHIVGGHDVVTVEHAQDMNKLLPDSRLHIVREGGHSILITHATKANKQILDVLGPCKEEPLANSRL